MSTVLHDGEYCYNRQGTKLSKYAAGLYCPRKELEANRFSML